MNRQIFVFAPIDAYEAQFIIQQLLSFDRENEEEITMFINSPGGSVYQMFAILDTMSMIKAPVRTVVIGVAASAAACLASAGKTRLISKTAEIMIHEASAGTYGTVSEMKESIDQIAKQNEIMIKVLAKNTNRSVEDIKATISKTDKYLSAQEAIEFGIADKIINDEEAKSLKLSEGINGEGFEINQDEKEVQILRSGRFEHPVYGRLDITESVLVLLKKNFEAGVRGQDISFDYTHDNDGGENPAAFWIKSLEIKDNSNGKGKGLFARVEFTPMGAKKVSEKEYKYSSADFVVDYMDHNGKHHPYVLRGGTLTNRPFIKEMDPIKLSEPTLKNKEATDMKKDELIAALKEHNVDVMALEGAAKRVKDLEASIAELRALPAQKEEEIKSLKAKLDEINGKIIADDKERTFDELVAQGKAVPAQKEKVMKVFETAVSMQEFYKDAPAIIKTRASGSTTEDVDGLTEAEAALVSQGAYSKEEIVKFRTIK